MRTPQTVIAVGILLAGAAVAAAVAAPAAAAGPTFTKITKPSGNLIFQYNEKVTPDANNFAVHGRASTDVDHVDIDCVFTSADGLEVETLAPDVPVSGSGTFSTIAGYPGNGPTVTCRLRAVPSSIADPTSTYLGAFAGPILYTNGALLQTTGPTTYGMVAVGEKGDGFAELTSAGECGTALVATIEIPRVGLNGTGSIDCAWALPGNNATAGSGSTASAVKVDGHNAYLPGAVHTYLDGTRHLSLTQTKLSVSVSRPNKSGDVAFTESAPLMRCAPDDTYPPTVSSCSSLVKTGVTFKRVSLIFRSAHQVRVRDTYTSDGSAHSVRVQYVGELTDASAGAPGYIFPGSGSTFHGKGLGATVTHLGTKAGTVLVRTDRFADSDDPAATSIGLTWSRAPKQVLFDGAKHDRFAMPYSLSVPANGHRYLGFAYSGQLLTKDAKQLAALAVGDMVSRPSISSPASAAHITGHKTTVKGSVTLGANGLPTKVTVDGHAATLKSNSTKTKATYSATFSESFGTHTIKVVASDSVGNRKSASIKVRNVS